MNITEKTNITHEVNFTQDDLDLIVYMLKKVWAFATVDRLIDHYDTGFAKILNMLSAIRENVFYNKKITDKHREVISLLSDTCCSFEAKFEEDERFADVDTLWLSVVKMLKEFNLED